jgi:type I restriction enzyme M protein
MQAEEAAQAIEEYVEEHGSEEGFLAEAMEDDKISKAKAADRLKQAKREGSDPDEIKSLNHLIDLYNHEGKAKRTLKEAQAALDLVTLEKYGHLTDTDVHALVLDDKWRATISSRIVNLLHSLAVELVSRIQQLGERYDETLADMEAELVKLDQRVVAHLADMGVK